MRPSVAGDEIIISMTTTKRFTKVSSVPVPALGTDTRLLHAIGQTGELVRNLEQSLTQQRILLRQVLDHDDAQAVWL